MPTIELTATAVERLDALIATYDLPTDTFDRVAASLEPLINFPLAGRALHGGWEGLRLLVGPWSWMLVIYMYDRHRDHVTVVTVQDARLSSSATTLEF